jgi:hypothetical protein
MVTMHRNNITVASYNISIRQGQCSRYVRVYRIPVLPIPIVSPRIASLGGCFSFNAPYLNSYRTRRAMRMQGGFYIDLFTYVLQC